jgi:regulator of sigma E protease
MLLTIVSLLIALSILVFVHELGHYLAARRAGIVVEEFGFGYPPRVLTLFHLPGKIILDGVEIVIPRGTYLHGNFHYGQSVVYQTRTGDDGRPHLAAIEPADESTLEGRTAPIEFLDPGTIFSLNAIPFGGFAKMLGEEDPSAPGSLAGKGKLARIFVLAAGAVMNLLIAILFFAAAMVLGAPAVDEDGGVIITDIAPGSPAEAADLQPNDIIHPGSPGPGGPALGRAWRRDAPGRRRPSPGPAARRWPHRDRHQPARDHHQVPMARGPLARHPTDRAHDPFYLYRSRASHPGSHPCRAGTPRRACRRRPDGRRRGAISLDSGWWYPVMQMMGSLGVALAVTNLLPLPALDGGRILFVIVEGIRGRRIDPAKEGLIHLIGMALLVALMLFITWQDVINPVPSIDWGNLF